MSQDVVYVGDNKEVCDAVGCSAQATKKMKVNVGQKGKISLYLCNHCVGKFV